MLTLAMMHKHQTITSCLEVEEYDAQGSTFFNGKGFGITGRFRPSRPFVMKKKQNSKKVEKR